MEVSNASYIVDVGKQSNELFAYLIVNYIPEGHIQDEKAFRKDLKQMLVELIEATVRRHQKKFVATRGPNDSTGVFEDFCEKYDLNAPVVESIVMDTTIVELQLQRIDEIAKDKPYMVWDIKERGGAVLIEGLGDYRILEWERDHIKGGKYVP